MKKYVFLSSACYECKSICVDVFIIAIFFSLHMPRKINLIRNNTSCKDFVHFPVKKENINTF